MRIDLRIEKNASHGEEEQEEEEGGQDLSLSPITDNTSTGGQANTAVLDKNCNHCGEKVPIDFMFCNHCGREQPATAALGTGAGDKKARDEREGDGQKDVSAQGHNQSSSGSDSDSDSSDAEGNVERLMKKFAPDLNRAWNSEDSSSEEEEQQGGQQEKQEEQQEEQEEQEEEEVDYGEYDVDHGEYIEESGVTPPLSVSDKRMCVLQRDLHIDDYAFKNLCVDLGLNAAEDFDFMWDKHSDKYRYLYEPDIAPFVNERGEKVEIHQIMAARNHLLRQDHESFQQTRELARAGVVKRRQFNLEWDAFCLYESDLILPFVNQAGQKITRSAIKAARKSRMQSPAAAAVPPKETETAAATAVVRNTYISARHLASEELLVLMKRRQVKEHKIMVFREELMEMRAKDLFIAAYVSAAKKEAEASEKDVKRGEKKSSSVRKPATTAAATTASTAAASIASSTASAAN
jgi:hypothetical protein